MDPEEQRALEAAMGYAFRNVAWLERALTHSSCRNAAEDAASEDNERLEFLGDRVLGLIVSQALFRKFPDWRVGRLGTSLARLASAPALEAAARRLDLGRYLRLGKGEELTGGRGKRNLLSDAFEAVTAAIYMDGGLDAAQQFIERTLLAPSFAAGLPALSEPDHKSALQAWLQRHGRASPRYRVARETGPDHRKQFVVELWLEKTRLAEAEGWTKKAAEQEAASIAIERLRREAGE
jgi:ribonuclease III